MSVAVYPETGVDGKLLRGHQLLAMTSLFNPGSFTQHLAVSPHRPHNQIHSLLL